MNFNGVPRWKSSHPWSSHLSRAHLQPSCDGAPLLHRQRLLLRHSTCGLPAHSASAPLKAARRPRLSAPCSARGGQSSGSQTCSEMPSSVLPVGVQALGPSLRPLRACARERMQPRLPRAQAGSGWIASRVFRVQIRFSHTREFPGLSSSLCLSSPPQDLARLPSTAGQHALRIADHGPAFNHCLVFLS